MKERLGGLVDTHSLEDDQAAPRSAYVSSEAIGDALGIVGALAYAALRLLLALSCCLVAWSPVGRHCLRAGMPHPLLPD